MEERVMHSRHAIAIGNLKTTTTEKAVLIYDHMHILTQDAIHLTEN